MESNGGGVYLSRILREIDALKAAKSDIEHGLSVIEAQLRQTTINQQKIDTIPNGTCRSISTIESDNSHGLSPDIIYRYSRHLSLSSFGVQGQSNLVKSSFLVVGAGGLGSSALLYLAACGVGRLGIVDHDVVELSNMLSQVIHTEAYIGQSKVKSAAAAAACC